MSLLLTLALLAVPAAAPLAPRAQEGPSAAASTEPDHPVDEKRRWRMQRSDALKDLELDERTTDEGFTFYIQRLPKQPENYVQQVIDAHLPWLVAAEEAFNQVTGFGPEREPVAIVVLASQGDLANYRERAPLRCYATGSTPYNPYLATVTLVNLRAKTPNKASVRTTLLVHSTVHGLWQAHAHTIDKGPGALWLKESLADYIATSSGKTPADLVLGANFSAEVDLLVPLCRVMPFSRHWLLPLGDLVEPPPDSLIVERLDRDLWGLPTEDFRTAARGRMAEVNLLFRYLYEGEHKAGLRSYIKRSLSGETSLAEALGEESLDPVAVDFWRSIFAEYKAAHPDFDLEQLRGPAEVAKAAELLGASAKVAVGKGVAPAGLPRPQAPEATPADTRLPAPVLDAETSISEALWLASQGRLVPAVALFDSVRGDLGGQLGESGERDLARVTELAALRLEYLQGLAAEHGRLRLPLNGKKASAKLLGVTETELQLEATKRIPATLPIEAWPLDELLNQAVRAKPPLGSDELRAFLGALVGSERWQRNLKKARGAGSPLETELLGLAARLKTGAAAHALVRVINAAEAESPDAAGIARAVTELAEGFASQPLIQEHRDYLCDRTRTALVETITDSQIQSVFHATKSSFDGAHLELVYDFASPEELADFLFEPGGITERTVGVTESAIPEDKWMHGIKNGALRARGVATLRHIAPLSGDISIDLLNMVYLDSGVVPTYQNAFTLVAYDDLEMSCICVHGFSDFLWRITRGSIESVEQERMATYNYETPYVIHLQSTKDGISTQADGSGTLSLPAMGEPRGYTVLMFNSDAVMGVKHLTIKGELDDNARGELARRCADGELAKMGLL